jgi:hypothetical protein
VTFRWPPSRRPRRAQHGDGLIELVVTTMLGVLLLAGAVILFVRAGNASGESRATTRADGVLRDAFATLEPDVRMAGWWGLTNRAERLSGSALPSAPRTPIDAQVRNNCGTNWTADLGHPIDARGHGYAGLVCAALRPAPGSDVLVVRRAEVAPAAQRGGAIAVRSTRAGGSIVLVGAPPAASAGDGAETHELRVNAYYVGELAPNADGQRQWALRRQTLTRSADGHPAVIDEVVAPGVESLRVILGVDTDGDGAAEVYVAPGAAELVTGHVVSVRVTLAAIADDREQAPERAADANGPPAALEPELRRRVSLERTIALRNAGVP